MLLSCIQFGCTPRGILKREFVKAVDDLGAFEGRLLKMEVSNRAAAGDIHDARSLAARAMFTARINGGARA